MYNRLLCFIGILLFVQACIKDIHDFSPESKKEYRTEIIGVVTDAVGHPLQNTMVTLAGKQVFSDAQGVYRFQDLWLNDIHNPIHFTKESYFNFTNSIAAHANSSMELKQTLIKKNFKETQILPITLIEIAPVTISFEGDALVTQVGNQPYSGSLLYAAEVLDLDRPMEKLAGYANATAVNERNELVALTHHSLLFLDLQTADGRKLKLKDGRKANIHWAAETSFPTANSAALWSFDEKLRLWQKEGTTLYQGKKFIGQAEELSTLAISSAYSSVRIHGRITDPIGRPVNGLLVRLHGEDGRLLAELSNHADGNFSASVPRYEKAFASIAQELCPVATIYRFEIPPLLTDTKLDDIQINIKKENLLTLNFRVLDCNSQPVKSGYIKLQINNQIFIGLVKDGMAQLQYINCSNARGYIAYFFDEVNQREALVFPTIASTANQITITVCQKAQNEYITIESSSLGIPKLEGTNFDYKINAKEKKISANFQSGQYKLQFHYNDEVENQVRAGEYEMFNGRLLDVRNAAEYAFENVKSNIVRIQNSEKAGSGAAVLGKFNFYITKSGKVHEVVGYFRKTI